tara:strand:+ start:316 stop:498 length:183 start_codon:yes stop_codon:yes gene_type:complete
MIDTEHHYLVMQIRDLLEKKLDLTIKDHGCWRIQALIHDELEEKKEIQEREKKLLTNTNK